MTEKSHILAFSGGVGGAKLALGLSHVLPAEKLSIVANTGDDFEHLGLPISPDLDTLMYTLAGRNNTEQGWGLAGESWQAMKMFEDYGVETWFQLGDQDIATHLVRAQMANQGLTLSQITERLCHQLGIKPAVFPMSDDPVRTMISTDQGELAFQHYFVRERCEPKVRGFRFDGIDEATPAPKFMSLLNSEELRAVIICPSNPFVSVRPILELRGVKEALKQSTVPVIAVSPIVAGKAIKGPAAKMLEELKLPTSALAVAEYYRGLIDLFVIDEADADQESAIRELGMDVRVAPTIMHNLKDKMALAEAVLSYC